MNDTQTDRQTNSERRKKMECIGTSVGLGRDKNEEATKWKRKMKWKRKEEEDEECEI